MQKAALNHLLKRDFGRLLVINSVFERAVFVATLLKPFLSVPAINNVAFNADEAPATVQGGRTGRERAAERIKNQIPPV